MRIALYRRGHPVLAVLLLAWGTTASGASPENSAVSIVSGTFGTIGNSRKLDISRQLTDVCGAGSQSCQVFCSETSFGRYSLGRAPICRVIYRCGAQEVRSAEAMIEEPLLLRCPQPVSPALDATSSEPN